MANPRWMRTRRGTGSDSPPNARRIHRQAVRITAHTSERSRRRTGVKAGRRWRPRPGTASARTKVRTSVGGHVANGAEKRDGVPVGHINLGFCGNLMTAGGVEGSN